MFRPRAFAIPPAPLALTVGGLMPFFGAALASVALQGDVALQAAAALVLLVYGAVILSFLGGVRWGVEMDSAVFEAPRWGVMTASVLGALIGWACVLYYILGTGAPWLFLVMAGAIALHWLWDMVSRKSLPAWYDGLRTIATLGAGGALILAWASLSGLTAFG